MSTDEKIIGIIERRVDEIIRAVEMYSKKDPLLRRRMLGTIISSIILKGAEDTVEAYGLLEMVKVYLTLILTERGENK